MSKESASPSRDLMRQPTAIVWDLPLGVPDAGKTLQRWLYDALRQAIVSGRLPGGSLLPGSRTLAQRYGVSRGTVSSAYEQLHAEGYVVSHARSGTRVCDTFSRRGLGRVLPETPAMDFRAAVSRDTPRQPDTPWVERLFEHESPFPVTSVTRPPQAFHPHRGDIRLFPVDLWRRLHVRQLRQSRLLALNDTSPAGLYELRYAIARHLAIARGVDVSPDQIAIVGSAQQALDLCLRLLTHPGDAVWMEDPGYVAARQIIHASGASIINVPVDESGMRVEDAIRQAPTAPLAYVTPSRQCPLGVPLSAARRHAILQWAIERNAVIFEDDYDSEYHFRAGGQPALRSLSGAEDHVVMVGTFSKLMFPSLRIAYAVLPPHLVSAFVRSISVTSRSANGLTQAVLADFLNEGHLDRHIRRTRRIYAARAEAFERSSQRYWKGLIETPATYSGLDAVCRLAEIDERTAVHKLSSVGIDAAPLAKYAQQYDHRAGLLMGFAAMSEEEIDQAAQRVSNVLRGP
ncbi:GntR family transcriptional regulator / MocR family aminotransferase [Pararobbsia alpina]|uniref:MocR-like pyridoxine biosynthesis transcription factor PdxR n=1 Tax=Pararobbsia alpina TaxID=621374 RepID=UPI0039A77C66